jgi:dihydrofolate reductase
MRRVVAYELVSLDGVAEAPDEFITGWDSVMDDNLAAVIRTQDAVLLGRRSHDEWAGYWPGSDIEPFATFINGVTKYVATSTPLTIDWPGSTVIEGDLAAFVRELLAAGLVDELRLVISPNIAGRGRRLLEGLPAIAMETLRTARTPTGHLLVDVRPATTTS